MTPRVNLLPSAYLRSRRRRRRIRVGALAAGALLICELALAALLSWRAEETRKLLQLAQTARSQTERTNRDLERPVKEAEILGKQVALASRLRSKHRWSRLLSTFAAAMPANVVLTSISTDPPQWTSALRPKAADNKDLKKQVEGIVVQGHAADHSDLATLISAIHASGTFASLDLRQARREKFMGHDAILFELMCRW